MNNDRIDAKIVRQIPAFRQLNDSECHELIEIAQQKSFAPGEKIVEQGKSSQNLWILLEGRCQVMRSSKHDGQVVLADMEPFNLFGEMSFFSPAPHSASVVAQTPVTLLCIARCDYDDLIRDGADAAYKLAYNVVESVATRLRRMDEWISELWDHDANGHTEKPPEWRLFREKVFSKWNL